jgi:carboxylesterase type B
MIPRPGRAKKHHQIQVGSPIIGITINYRLGPWGYLASSEILDDGAANAGLRDQRMAFQWIKENIAAFGGDCDKITIMGESAGATCELMFLSEENESELRGTRVSCWLSDPCLLGQQ